jgi:hypothetical protein
MGDLVMSRTTGRGLGITGGSAYKIECISTANIIVVRTKKRRGGYMPVVTINPDHYDRAELKSAPKDPTIEGDEDGYIMLRPLPYGEKQKIRDRSTKMFMRSVTQKRQKGKMREFISG